MTTPSPRSRVVASPSRSTATFVGVLESKRASGVTSRLEPSDRVAIASKVWRQPGRAENALARQHFQADDLGSLPFVFIGAGVRDPAPECFIFPRALGQAVSAFVAYLAARLHQEQTGRRLDAR